MPMIKLNSQWTTTRWLVAVAAWVLMCTAASSAAPPQHEPPLESTRAARQLRGRVKGILRKARLKSVSVGIVIADAKTGVELVRVRPDQLFNPASTLKIFTAAAALHALGPDHVFTTELVRDGDTLILRGDGDPQLMTEHLAELVADAKSELRDDPPARLLVDTSRFTGGVLPPGFGKKTTDASYRAATGAVAMNYGSVVVTVRPTRDGRRPSVTFDPPGRYVVLDNQARTVAGKGSTLQLRMRKKGTRSVAVLTGRIGTRKRAVAMRRRVEHPPLAAGYALQALLRDKGIRIPGRPDLGKSTDAGEVLATHRSAPLSESLAGMNKYSNNFIAEMTLRAIGTADDERSTWDRSRERVRDFLTDTVGLNGFEYNNGSGLYDGGRFTPRQVVRLLVHMNSDEHRAPFRDSLAVAGRPGTLEKRMLGHRLKVIGKTGTLNNASALSGYARSRSGRLLAFSILMNNTNKATARMRAVQDRIAATLVDMRL